MVRSLQIIRISKQRSGPSLPGSIKVTYPSIAIDVFICCVKVFVVDIFQDFPTGVNDFELWVDKDFRRVVFEKLAERVEVPCEL